MGQFYFDTSAIVKYYHDEPGSDWVRQIINARAPDDLSRTHSIYLAEIAIAETAAAFAVLERTKQIRKPARDAMYREFLRDVASNYVTIHVRREEIDRAAELTQQHDLKGYDAIQLAVALHVNDLLQANDLSLIFISGDDNQLQAARAEGLATENPFDHE